MSLENDNQETGSAYGNRYWCRDYEGNTYTYDEYRLMIESFHGYAAPGLVVAGKMVDICLSILPEDILFDVVCETDYCLPDAVQLLTLCTTGNGWMKVIHLGRYALSMYDKYTGEGIRVSIDSEKIKKYPEIETWFFKTKPKNEQKSELLAKQIYEAGDNIFSVIRVKIKKNLLEKRSLGITIVCPLCGEAYPEKHGKICRGCQGENPFIVIDGNDTEPELRLNSIPVEDSVGKSLLHDMTRIKPHEEKKPLFKKGQVITETDLCQLHLMGRNHVYTEESLRDDKNYIHEDEAALSFAKRLCGERIIYTDNPSEGKINFKSAIDGLLVIDEKTLEMFNLVPGVMCATRKNYSVVARGRDIGGTRAIPLFLSRIDFNKAITVLDKPVLNVLPFRRNKIGVLITGTEVFNGLIEDRFEEVVRSKAEKLNLQVVASVIVPDDVNSIVKAVDHLIEKGAEVIVTTAGLSVDPEDVTREGLVKAGAENILYGAPILPGAMTILCNINSVKILGIPACGLYHRTTGFDLIFPRVLADVEITRNDLAKMGHGSFCLSCKTCRFPRCSFGK